MLGTCFYQFSTVRGTVCSQRVDHTCKAVYTLAKQMFVHSLYTVRLWFVDLTSLPPERGKHMTNHCSHTEPTFFRTVKLHAYSSQT